MQALELEPRPLYGIGTVARLTGLKPDTLRVWERRYGLGATSKSATGRRQYSQTDLEHLQLIAALVESGTRIGEIAASERKTLELMLRAQGRSGTGSQQPEKPRVVFVGKQLCSWLDAHQGCVALVDALLARVSPGHEELVATLEGGTIDTLVLEFPNLNASNMQQLSLLVEKLHPGRTLVLHQVGSERSLEQLQKMDIVTVAFPPDPGFLAYEMSCSIAEKAISQGDSNPGELVAAKPRQFSRQQLSAASAMQGHVDCECPRHLAQLIATLANFEDYSASCSTENWHDAAIHSCIFAYAGQARWLMEKALHTVLEDHRGEYSRRLQQQD